MRQGHDITVRWNDKPSAAKTIRRAGGVPIHGYPYHLRCPGGVVAIVDRNNQIPLMFLAKSIVV